MKKIKPVLMLFTLLMIGFALGFLVSGQLTRKKMDDFLRWGTEDGFKEIMYEQIEPNNQQRTQLEPIIDKYAKLNGELQNSWKKEHGQLMKNLTNELKEVLSDEQMKDWQGHSPAN